MTARRALLVACAEYRDPKLRTLRSPVHDVDGLAAVLSDPAIGGFEVETLINRTDTEVRRAVARFLRTARRTDTLLLHFACHGFKDVDGQLYLTASDTELDDVMVSAVPAELLSRLVNRSPSRRVILVLDCCFSGAISRVMTYRGQREVDVGGYFARGEGLAVLAASRAEEYAWEPAGDPLALRDNAMHSVFAEALIEGLKTGAADLDGDGEISIDELYLYVHDRVTATGSPQTPMRWSFLQGTLLVAHRASAGPELAAARPAGSDPASAPAAPRGTARSPWDAHLLNWRFPVTPAVDRLIRGYGRGGAEAYAWGALRNGEWDRAAVAFDEASGSAPDSPLAWWGWAVSRAIGGGWRAAGEGFARAADRVPLDPADPQSLGMYAGAVLLGAVAFTAAGSRRAQELLDDGLDRVPYCPHLLAYRAVVLGRREQLGAAFLFAPDLVSEFAAVGVDVAEAVGQALAEAERRTAALVRASGRVAALRQHVPGLPPARPVPGPVGQRLPADRRLDAYGALASRSRRILAAEVVDLQTAADTLLAAAVDRRAMALVDEIRHVTSDITGALAATDRPVPVAALGLPPRIER
ncbi:caspase, EACC1-associated type [Planosporangium sp. 12N6]|uniref:caspase family protein n=1 Tax=Planosporangium spinosum TaxID=3402278 RepID=UPI003CE9DDFB